MKKIAFIFTLLTSFFTLNFAYSEDLTSGEKYLIDTTVRKVSAILKNNGWNYFATADGSIRGYKFGMDYNELSLKIEFLPKTAISQPIELTALTSNEGPESAPAGQTLPAQEESALKKTARIVKVTVVKNERPYVKVFKLTEEDIDDVNTADSKIIPFFIQYMWKETINQEFAQKKVYDATVSLGYTRTNDTQKYYPKKGEGYLYFAGSLVYDPAKFAKERKLVLRSGSYFSFDLYGTFNTKDKEVKDHFFDAKLLLIGVQRYSKQDRVNKRFLHGIFMTCEYFRPAWADSTMLWSHDIYRDSPHIQYIVFQPANYGAILNLSKGENSPQYTLAFNAGFGPSINSSIIMTNISEAEEQGRNKIFKAQNHKKQNFYYSTCIPVSFSIGFDKLWRLKGGIKNNYYYFDAFEDSSSHENLNIFTIYGGVYILPTLTFETRYEKWNIHSKVEPKTLQHNWNRIVMELKYNFR